MPTRTEKLAQAECAPFGTESDLGVDRVIGRQSPIRTTCGACNLMNVAIASGSDATTPSRSIFPVRSMMQHPGGGGAERLPHLVGRGRAFEIILGANDFDGDTAERYGYVNRALPDAELDGFVDALARRIASFDQRAITTAKNFVNQVSRCHPPTRSSTPSPPLRPRSRGPKRNSESKLCWSADCNATPTSRNDGPRCSAHFSRLSHQGRSRFASATDCSVLFGGFIATMPGSDFSGPCIRSNTDQVSARTAEMCVIHNSIKIDSAIQSTPHSLP
jgi:hypothetical protein